MKKIITIGVIILLFGITLPSGNSVTVSNSISTDLYCRIFCFGSIENIVFSDNLLDIYGKNLLCIEYLTFNEFKSFSYGHFKNGMGIHHAIGKFDFHGILEQHFICGYFVLNNSEESFISQGVRNQYPIGLGVYFLRDFFIGEIANITIEGNDYVIDALNLWRYGIWWYNGSRGFEIDHARYGTRYCLFGYVIRGIIKPDFIFGIGRHIRKIEDF